MLDYLVVGLGLAGISFCEELERNGKTFKVFNDHSQTSSIVAGGIYNPVVLKRLNLAWKADAQVGQATEFYRLLEDKLQVTLVYETPILRRFASIEEQNLWFEAAEHPRLKPFLSNEIIENGYAHIYAPYGFGKVLHTGRLDTGILLETYQNYLLEEGLLVLGAFVYDQLRVFDDYISYNTIKARRIVFAEGYGLKKNPFFNYLPLNGSKGEYIMIQTSQKNENVIIKGSIFLIPEGTDRYRVGATYDWKDKTNKPTKTGKKQLKERLDRFLRCEYEIVDQLAGVRPTVLDRRPLVGRHPKYLNVYVLNGFGSRGVMIAPFASKKLFDFIEDGRPLFPEMDVSRFTEKFFLD